MSTRAELYNMISIFIHKGFVFSPENKPVAYKASYRGVLGDIQQIILEAHDLRGSGPREQIDRIVADLAHIMVLIQNTDAQTKPNRSGELLSYAADLLLI